MDVEPLELAMEKIDMTTFDAQHFESLLTDNSLPFLIYKIFQNSNFLATFHIDIQTLVNFGREM